MEQELLKAAENSCSERVCSAHLWALMHNCMCAPLCLTLCDPMDWSPRGSSVHGIFQPRILTGFHFLLQGIFPTQGLSSCLLQLLHCRWILYHRHHLGSPVFSELGFYLCKWWSCRCMSSFWNSTFIWRISIQMEKLQEIRRVWP